MARLFFLVLLAALTLLPAAVLAQTPEPVPTAGPDEIVIAGEVPAPPGTEVSVHYAFLPDRPPEAGTLVVCGTTTTTPSISGDPNISRFVVVFDAACGAGAAFGPTVCWGENRCRGAIQDLLGTSPQGGDVIETGLLSPASPEGATPTPPAGAVHGDRGPEIGLPATGEGQGLDDRSRSAWLLWAGVGLLAAGLAVGGVSVAVRRRR